MLACSAVRGAMPRLALSMALISAWLILLLTGWVLGGATHLLLAAALVLFPWREIPYSDD